MVSLNKGTTGQIALLINDNGKGFDKSYDTLKESLGMKMIKILTKQLDGAFIVESAATGVTYRIDFPVES